MLCRRTDWRTAGQGAGGQGKASRSSANSAEPARPAGWIMPHPAAAHLERMCRHQIILQAEKALDSRQVWGGRRGRGVVVIVVAAVVRHWQHLWRYVKNCRMQSKNKKKAKPNNAQQTEGS